MERHEGKRPLGRLERRREDNIKMGVKETVWDSVDWVMWLRTGRRRT
jgi:hypothetical protein